MSAASTTSILNEPQTAVNPTQAAMALPRLDLQYDPSEREWFAFVPDLGRELFASTRERLQERIADARRIARKHALACPEDTILSA